MWQKEDHNFGSACMDVMQRRQKLTTVDKIPVIVNQQGEQSSTSAKSNHCQKLRKHKQPTQIGTFSKKRAASQRIIYANAIDMNKENNGNEAYGVVSPYFTDYRGQTRGFDQNTVSDSNSAVQEQYCQPEKPKSVVTADYMISEEDGQHEHIEVVPEMNLSFGAGIQNPVKENKAKKMHAS